MNRRSLTLVVVALLVLAGGTALFLHYFKRESREINLPPKGEAAYNPLYALRQALLAQGIKARSYPSLNPTALELGRNDTLVLYTQPEAISEAQSERLLAWVEKGGHLVMPGPEFGEDPGPLANQLELRAMPYPKSKDSDDDEEIDYYAHCTRIATGGPKVEVESEEADAGSGAAKPVRPALHQQSRRIHPA